MTDTKAGRVLLDAIATNERLSLSGLRMAEYRQAIAAIEREAAQQGVAEGAAQERERIRAAVTAYDYWATRDVNDHMSAPEEMQADILAILAEPSG